MRLIAQSSMLLFASLIALPACEGPQTPSPAQVDATSAPDLTTEADPDALTPAEVDADTAASADVEAPADAASLPDASLPDATSADAPPPDDVAPAADASAPADSGGPDATPGDVGLSVPTLPEVRPPVVATHVTTLSAFTLQPGRETTRCVLKRLGNAEVLWVTDIATRLAPGSHHLIVYKSTETEEQPTPFACDPFVETLRGETYPIMITQIREETLSFPNGVAFRFEPNQMVRLEAHYLNYYPDPIEASAEVTFKGIAASDVASEANLLFYGNPDLSIPARSTLTSPWRHLSVLPGTRVFALTGHTHAFGTGVDIQVGPDDASDGTVVYPPAGQSFVWDEPPMATFSPPLAFDGTQGFRYRCAWNNTTDATLGFGESARQEMCFFWAYYYPSQGYRICVNPGNIGNGAAGPEICCPGHWACSYLGQRL
jgi:hypothetical protein